MCWATRNAHSHTRVTDLEQLLQAHDFEAEHFVRLHALLHSALLDPVVELEIDLGSQLRDQTRMVCVCDQRGKRGRG